MKACYIDFVVPYIYDPENTTQEEYEAVIEIYENIIYSIYYESEGIK